jgi:hypothetical protein
MHPTHPTRGSHKSSPATGEEETAPAAKADDEAAADEGQGDCDREARAVETASAAGVFAGSGGAGYQGFVEDSGSVGEEGVAVCGRVAAEDVEGLEDWMFCQYHDTKDVNEAHSLQ